MYDSGKTIFVKSEGAVAQARTCDITSCIVWQHKYQLHLSEAAKQGREMSFSTVLHRFNTQPLNKQFCFLHRREQEKSFMLQREINKLTANHHNTQTSLRSCLVDLHNCNNSKAGGALWVMQWQEVLFKMRLIRNKYTSAPLLSQLLRNSPTHCHYVCVWLWGRFNETKSNDVIQSCTNTTHTALILREAPIHCSNCM